MLLETEQKILLEKGCILEDWETISVNKRAYYNAYLLANFGIEITNPEKTSKQTVEVITGMLKKNVPNSFYDNPQNMRFFSSEELLIEQLVSYLTIAIEGAKNEDTNFNRIEVFKKALPQYTEGEDIKLRKYTIVDLKTAEKIYRETYSAYCNYTRPFNNDEWERFTWLLENNYITEDIVKSKDNIIKLVEYYYSEQKYDYAIKFAKMLDGKDVVKYSKNKYGEMKKITDNIKLDEVLNIMVTHCKLIDNASKKQAKGFNALAKLFNVKREIKSINSTDKLAKQAIRDNNVVKASEIYASQGAMLERNLMFLLSRATPVENVKILENFDGANPLVLMQLIQKIDKFASVENRCFTFYKNGKIRKHKETDEEAKWRKTKLTKANVEWVKNALLQKVKEYYKTKKEKLGKVYLDDEFKGIAIPFNTSANNKGLDVLPTGSRRPIPYNNIRLFCYWYNAFDIDTSCLAIKDDGRVFEYSWRTYGIQPFGNSMLCSGDCRSSDGAEYTDLRLDELKAKGVKYIVYTINAFAEPNLNKGEIFTGYQNLQNLEVKAWNPKNIETQIQVKGDSKSYLGFAIDLTTNEFITLNLVEESNKSVVSKESLDIVNSYLQPLNFDMYELIGSRATELVSDPEEADLVFSSTYTNQDKRVITPYQVGELIKLI